jgi:hypothetical protein
MKQSTPQTRPPMRLTSTPPHARPPPRRHGLILQRGQWRHIAQSPPVRHGGPHQPARPPPHRSPTFHHADDGPRSPRRLGSRRCRLGILPANKNTSRTTAASSLTENSFMPPLSPPYTKWVTDWVADWRRLPSLKCPAMTHFLVCLSLLEIVLCAHPNLFTSIK